jgi:hypothetical protein
MSAMKLNYITVQNSKSLICLNSKYQITFQLQ